MAFLSKVGGILRQSVCKQVDLHLSSSSPSVFQAKRRMSSSKVFIGGLSYSTDDTSLQEAFAKYGNVVDAKVIVDRDTNRSRGFGFVTYTSSEEASCAIQALDQQNLHGRRVRVAYATERSRSAGFGGGYGAGGGGYGAGGGGYGGGAGYGGYGDAGGYGGGSANYGGNGGSYGGYGGSGSGSQGGVNGYGSGGATYGGGSLSTGDNPGGYNAGGYGGGSGGSYGAAGGGGGANFDVSGGTGGNVTSDTSFASSGFEGGSGLGYSGGSSSDPIGTSGLEDSAGNYEANEPLDRDDRDEDEPDDYAKRA